MFARAPSIGPLKLIFSLVSSPFLKFGMPSIATVYSEVGVATAATVSPVVGVATAATVSPVALTIGITVSPCGTALRKKILVSVLYAVNASSGDEKSMNRVSG